MNKRNAETFKNNDLLIKSSFLKLLPDKDFPKITVDMICSEANINRSTFYFHFSDKYMLFKAIGDDIKGELSENLKRTKETDPKPSLNSCVSIGLELIKKYMSYFSARSQDIEDIKDAYDSSNVFSDCNASASDLSYSSDQGKEYVEIGIRSGLETVTDAWLSKKCEDDVEALADTICRIIKMGCD